MNNLLHAAMAASRGARNLAYPLDMSLLLRAVLLALASFATVFHKFDGAYRC